MNSLVVDHLRLASISALPIFEEKYPELLSVLNKSQRPSNDWNFFMTAAGIGLVLMKLSNQDTARKDILDRAVAVDKQLPVAVDNLFEFLRKKKLDSAPVDVHQQIGIWVLWNIAGACPSYEECSALAPVIGSYLSSAVDEFE